MSAPPSKPDDENAELPFGATDILARAVQGGDRASFPQLFERVLPALETWIRHHLRGRRDRDSEAEDIRQEVWLRALQKFSSYDRSRSFRPWILGIAKNVLLQFHARRTPLPLAQPTTGSSTDLEKSAALTSIATRLAKDDSLRLFLEFVEGLAPEDRAMLIYCGIEGYSCAQAASRLMIQPDAASKRWQTLRARIRQNASVEALAQTILE